MASRDYWWTCRQCGASFEHLDPYVQWASTYQGRRRLYKYDCAKQHETDNEGHRCYRRLAPGV